MRPPQPMVDGSVPSFLYVRDCSAMLSFIFFPRLCSCDRVQGCGRGYDVAMLALHGFDVYGLEVSSKGARIARDYASRELQSPQAFNYGREGWSETQSGSVEIIAGDFFARDWEALLGEAGTRGFDLIYDYTVCMVSRLSRRT